MYLSAVIVVGVFGVLVIADIVGLLSQAPVIRHEIQSMHFNVCRSTLNLHMCGLKSLKNTPVWARPNVLLAFSKLNKIIFGYSDPEFFFLDNKNN